MNTETNVVVVGVTYGSDDAAVDFVRAVAQCHRHGVGLSVVVVDNTERSDSSDLFARIEAASPGVLCVKSPQNLGYFAGASWGLSEWRRQACVEPDWTVVSNVDIEFRQQDFFTELGSVPVTEDIGLVAPAIWSDLWSCDRNPKFAVRPSSRRMRFYKVLYRDYYVLNLYMALAWLKSRVRYARRRVKRCSEKPGANTARAAMPMRAIYAAQGSCFVFSKWYFSKGGNLEYPCFLFGEEVFVAETVRALGIRIIHYPRLVVNHTDHVSTGLAQSHSLGSFLKSRTIARHMHDSAVYVADKYFN
jgi:GT2 family glycosyltransferase